MAKSGAGFYVNMADKELQSTHQHVLSAFIPSRVTVEVLSEAGFYMSSFILQNKREDSKGSEGIAVTKQDINLTSVQLLSQFKRRTRKRN